MRRKWNPNSMPRLKVSPWLLIFLCLFYRLDPVGCFWPFLAAGAIHELAHCLAVLLCGGKITALRLGPAGAVMETSPLSYGQEALCALAGPIAGFLLLGLARWLPWLAFWGLVQGVYNLLPVYHMDGGRALRCLLLGNLPYEQGIRIAKAVTVAVGAVLALLGVYATCVLHWGLWSALVAGLLLWRVLNCVQGEPG